MDYPKYPNTSKTGMVVYKSKMTHRKIKGGKKNFGIYAAQEFIASIRQHIPDKNFRNHIGDDAIYSSMGINKDEMDLNYSNRMRGDRLKIEQVVHENQQQELGDVVEVIDVSGYKPCRIPQ